jgi:DNA-directed RNA polymerase specialized sigma24 family protein
MRCMEAATAGDARAMGPIYERHHRGLLAFCRHMLGSREAAEQVVRDTFRSAQRELARSEEPVALRPWLYAIACNRCMAILRAGAPPRHDDSVRGLGRLPVDERAALLLAEDGDLGPEEIGQVLGVPVERAEALVVHARDSLIAPRRPLTAACAAVRAELARPGTGEMRRSYLRRHLRECPRCRGYRESVRRQHAALSAPVAASAGLREAAVGAGPPPRRLPVAKLAIGAALAAVAILAILAVVDALSEGTSKPAAKPPVADAAQPPRPKAAPAAAAPAHRRRNQHRRHHRRHHRRAEQAQTAAAAPAPQPVAQPAPAPPPPVATSKPKQSKSRKDKGSGDGKRKQPTTSRPKTERPDKAPKAPKAPQPAAPEGSATGGAAAPPAESDEPGTKGHGGG